LRILTERQPGHFILEQPQTQALMTMGLLRQDDKKTNENEFLIDTQAIDCLAPASALHRKIWSQPA